MSVLSSRELVGRGFQHKFGDAPTASRQFALTLDDPNTPTQEMLDFVNIKHGDYHPEYTYLRCVDGSVTENSPDPWHAEISYSYELPPLGGNKDFNPNPLARPDVWSFSTGGAQIPALTYWDEDTKELRPLVNSADDFFEGLTTQEAEVRLTVSGNRPFFPLGIATGITNGINGQPYLGGAKYTWKCTGISAQQQSEVVNGAEIAYWAVTAELVYRQSTWLLKIPDIGWTYIDAADGDKRKGVYVLGPYNEKIAASNPQALNEDGGLKCPGGGPCIPDILERRVNVIGNFDAFFGTPPP